MFKDSPGAEAFVKFMASPEAGEGLGQATAASRRRIRTCPRAPIRTRSRARRRRSSPRRQTFRFDMSDLAPASFGGTPGQGEWKILAGLHVKNPNDVDGTAQQARGGRGEGVQERRRTVATPAAIPEAAPAPSPRRRPAEGKWGQRLVVAGVPGAGGGLPDRLARLSDDPHDHPELLRPATAADFVGLDNYKDAVHDRHAQDRDQEQRDLARGRARARSPRSG